MDIDPTEVERQLCRLPEVNVARMVVDQIGRPTELHVIASTAKPPKTLVRDIQSVAMAGFGLELDRRIISIVQLDDERTEQLRAEPVGEARVTVTGLTAETTGVRVLVRVTLTQGKEEGSGFAEGSVASTARHRLVAQATLDALRQLHPVADCADIEMAGVARLGQRDVALAAVTFVVPPREEVVSGSAVVRGPGEENAVVRAVLDATNRRLAGLAG